MSFATKQRLLLGIAVLMILTPTILYSAGLLGRAPIYEGDVRKEMTCITCDGLGRSAGEESCSTCRGRGVADFIIPGPNRPLQLVGTVKASTGETVEGADIACREAEGNDMELLFKSNGDGQFGIKLPPGTYIVKVSAPDKGSVSESVLVEANTDPLPARGTSTLHILEKDFMLAK
jgi:Carboxypeptidase regulatory-like domain